MGMPFKLSYPSFRCLPLVTLSWSLFYLPWKGISWFKFISYARLASDSISCLFAHISCFVFALNLASCQTTFFFLEEKYQKLSHNNFWVKCVMLLAFTAVSHTHAHCPPCRHLRESFAALARLHAHTENTVWSVTSVMEPFIQLPVPHHHSISESLPAAAWK